MTPECQIVQIPLQNRCKPLDPPGFKCLGQSGARLPSSQLWLRIRLLHISSPRRAVHVELTNAACARDCARRRNIQMMPTNSLLAQFDRASNQLVRSGRN